MARGTDRAGRRAVTNLKGGDRTPGPIPVPSFSIVVPDDDRDKRSTHRWFALRTPRDASGARSRWRTRRPSAWPAQWPSRSPAPWPQRRRPGRDDRAFAHRM